MDIPLWASLYLAGVVLLAAWSTIDDVRSRKAVPWIVADLLALVALVVLFTAHFVPSIGIALGRLAAPLFLTGFAWTAFSAHRDIMSAPPDPELSDRANLVGDHVGVLIGVVAFAPLIGFAAVAARHAW